MGFDVSGIRPKNKKGDYFRNNVWWWRRLWDFCCYITPEITEEDRSDGHMNDGHKITGKKHSSLVKNLEKALQNKDKYKEWIRSSEEGYIKANQKTSIGILGRKKAMQEKDFYECSHPFSWGNVEDFYEFIKNNEGFAIY